MEEKLILLKTRLKEYMSAVIAFSGGVDSTFLARIAKDVYGDNLLLITATSSTYPFYELEESKSLALMLGIKHKMQIILPTDAIIAKVNCLEKSNILPYRMVTKLFLTGVMQMI